MIFDKKKYITIFDKNGMIIANFILKGKLLDSIICNENYSIMISENETKFYILELSPTETKVYLSGE